MQLNFLMEPIYRFQPPKIESVKKSKQISSLSDTDKRINRFGQIKRKASSDLTEEASLKTRIAAIDRSRKVKKSKVVQPVTIKAQKFFFNDLPTDIIGHICSFLDIKDVSSDDSRLRGNIEMDNEVANFLRTTETLKKMALFYFSGWLQQRKSINFYQFLSIKSYLGIAAKEVGKLALQCINLQEFSASPKTANESGMVCSLLANMKSLQNLILRPDSYCSHISCGQLQIAAALPNLRSLDFKIVPILLIYMPDPAYPYFFNIKKLNIGPTWLKMKHCEILTKIFPNVENLSINFLDIDVTRYSDFPFKNLSSLTTISLKLHLDDDDLMDIHIRSFFSMPKLKSLTLKNFNVDIAQEALDELQFSELEKIDFSECTLAQNHRSDTFVEKMKEMTAIEFHPPLN